MHTTTELSENSHQGFEGLKAALCLASMEAKSNNASGLPVCLWQEGTGSRCSGKERDETGFDYFGARYFSGEMGRFMSPDKPILDQHIGNPQSWNLYSYARNNPLLFTDPAGEKIELIGDATQRWYSWLFLLGICGGNCVFEFDEELRQKEGRDVIIGVSGIKDPKSDVQKDLIMLIVHPEIVEFALTSKDLTRWSGAATFKPGEDGDNKNVRVLVNPKQMDKATKELDPNKVINAFRWKGQAAPRAERWKVHDMVAEVATWHEFGHAWGYINRGWLSRWLFGLPNKPSLEWENRMREQLYGPFGPENSPRLIH